MKHYGTKTLILLLPFLLLAVHASEAGNDQETTVIKYSTGFGEGECMLTIFSEMVSNGPGPSELIVSQRGLICPGNPGYRNFFLSGLPDRVHFQALLTREDGIEIAVDTFLVPSDTSARLVLMKLPLEKNHTYGISYAKADPDPIHGPSLRLQRQKQEIDRYYSIAGKLESIESMLADTTAPPVSRLPLVILQHESALDSLKKIRRLVGSAALPGADLLRIVPRLNEAFDAVEEKIERLNQNFDQINIYYLEQARQSWANGDSSLTKALAGKSFFLNQAYWPSAQFLISIFLLEGQPEAADSIIRLFREHHAGFSDEDPEVNGIVVKVADSYASKTEMLIGEGSFIMAGQLLQKATSFVEDFDVNSFPDIYESLKYRLHKGMVESYVRIGRRSINASNPRLAAEYFDKARQYVLEMNGTSQEAKLPDRYKSMIIEASRQLGDHLLARHYYPEAIEVISAGNILCQTLHEGDCSPIARLAMKADEKVNPPTEEDGSIERITGTNEQPVYSAFNEKQATAPDGNNTGFDNMEQDVTDDINIEESLKLASFLVWKNQADSAAILLDMLRSRAPVLDAGQRQPLMTAIAGIENEMAEKHCRSVEMDYRNFLLKAGAMIRKQDYYGAGEKLTDALQLLEQQEKLCSLENSGALKMKAEIAGPAKYQAMMISLHSLITEGSFDIVHDIYKEAGKFFRDNRLNDLGLKHPDYMSLVTTKGNNEFIIFTCIEKARQDKTDEAMILLRELRKRACDAAIAQEAQQITGEAMGRRDKKDGRYTNPLTYLQEHTGRDPWYDAFKKAYLRSFRKN